MKASEYLSDIRDDVKNKSYEGVIERLMFAIIGVAQLEAQVERLRDGHLKQLAETDYCYVCDGHTHHHDGTSDCPIDVASSNEAMEGR